MSNIEHIRKQVFRVTQADFATIAGVTQATVSRWESGAFDPSLDELRKIRDEALARNLDWQDSQFFDAPTKTHPASVA